MWMLSRWVAMTLKLVGVRGDGAKNVHDTIATKGVRNSCIGGAGWMPQKKVASTAIPVDSTRPRWPKGPVGEPWSS